MPSKKIFRLKVIAAIILLFLALSPLQDSIDRQRKTMGFEQRLLLMPGQITGSLVLGGFRGLAADLLWIQIEDLFHNGQMHKMLPLFRTVTFLQPNFITPWIIGGWHLAYNISVMAKTEEEKAQWIRAGIDFLKEGLTYNPDRYDIYFELGWTNYHKLQDYAEAAKYFELACKFPRPEYVDNMLAHAYFKNGEKDKAMAKWREIVKGKGTFSYIASELIDRVNKYGDTVTPDTK